MANFAVLPFRYLPGTMTIDQGPADRIQRSVLVVSDPPLQHEEYGIITVSADIPDINKEALLAEVCTILARDHGTPVTFPRVYPLGVGLVCFASPMVRDRLISTSPHALDSDEDMTFSVIRHDEGLNRCAPVFQHEAWVMFLMFPLDFQTTYYVNKAVSLFGKLLLWPNPRVNKVRVLVKVLIKELRLVPFSLLMAQAGNFFGSEGGSWSIPVYILDGRAVAPEAVGNEEPVPPMNVTPHPYELPFLNDLQQHHLNLQIWNQQNADLAWEQEAPGAAQQNQDGWGQWPVEAPPQHPEIYRGISFRALMGYDGPSMMDGLVPDHNVMDNPSAWSPESDFLSEVEAAADAVINGSSSGALSFCRATGAIMELEVESGVATPGSRNVAVVSPLQSVLLVSVAGFQFLPASFAALMKFLGSKIYAVLPALGFMEPSSHSVREDLNVEEVMQLCIRLNVCFFLGKLVLGLSGLLPEDLALRFEISAVLSFQRNSWVDSAGGLMLDDEGKVFWAEYKKSADVSEAESSSSVSAFTASSQEVGFEACSVVATGCRRKGRSRKIDAPQVESEVKRSLRSNSQGYKYEMLSYQPSRRKISKVPVTTAPAVLQIEEMQRIGVEECQIDPAALMVERLMKQHEEKD
jgi:hypothetical protein